MASEREAKPGNLPVFIRVAMFWCCYMVVLFLASIIKARVPLQWGPLLWGLMSSTALLFVTWAFLRREDRSYRDIGLNIEAMSFARLVSGIVIGLAIFAVILSLTNIIAGPVRLIRGIASLGTMGILGGTFLALACMEELGFRGYALRTLVRTMGLWRAQIIVAVAFGLSHVAFGWSWINILVGVIPFALLFGIVATSSRGLAMPIGVHAGVNFAQWAVSEPAFGSS